MAPYKIGYCEGLGGGCDSLVPCNDDMTCMMCGEKAFDVSEEYLKNCVGKEYVRGIYWAISRVYAAGGLKKEWT